MVDVILLFWTDDVALLRCGPGQIHLDVLWPDDFRQVLQRVQHLIAEVKLDEFEVLEAHPIFPLFASHLGHVPLLLLNHLKAPLPHLLLKVEVVEN